jgi:type III restriction enzyme
MPEEQIPIQPVENPILCSPYREPDQHWLYDTKTGIPSKTPGRRPASYWFKTERTGSAQRSLLAEEERDDLPLVNALREGLMALAGLTVLRAR